MNYEGAKVIPDWRKEPVKLREEPEWNTYSGVCPICEHHRDEGHDANCPWTKKQLKPCPFCGDAKFPHVVHSGASYWVHCDSCGCEGPYHTREIRAVEFWNKRAGFEVSSTIGDLPESVAGLLQEGHIWDNMTISEQRDWAIKQTQRFLENAEHLARCLANAEEKLTEIRRIIK